MAIGGLVIYVGVLCFRARADLLAANLRDLSLKNRGVAMSAVTVTNWAMNLAGGRDFPNPGRGPGACRHVSGCTASWAIGAWIFFYRLVPETKGKSLEQIEAHWRSGKTPRQL